MIKVFQFAAWLYDENDYFFCIEENNLIFFMEELFIVLKSQKVKTTTSLSYALDKINTCNTCQFRMSLLFSQGLQK